MAIHPPSSDAPPSDVPPLRPRTGGEASLPMPPGSVAGPSTKLAWIVLGLLLGIFVVGMVALGLTSGAPPSATTPAVVTAKGAGLHAVAAKTALAPITSAGQPPTDIIESLAVPAGTAIVPDSTKDDTLGTYDHTVGEQVAASQGAVITFFRRQLPSEGWTSISSGAPDRAALAPPGSIEVLGRHPSGDGNYWEVGVVVNPTTFAGGDSTTGAGAGTETTTFSLRLYIVSDEQ